MRIGVFEASQPSFGLVQPPAVRVMNDIARKIIPPYMLTLGNILLALYSSYLALYSFTAGCDEVVENGRMKV